MVDLPRQRRVGTHTGVSEINTHLAGAGVFNVPTPLPLFQSWRKAARQQLNDMIELHGVLLAGAALP